MNRGLRQEDMEREFIPNPEDVESSHVPMSPRPLIQPLSPPITQVKMRRKVALELLKEDMNIANLELEKEQPNQALLNPKLQTIQQLLDESEDFAGQVLDYYVKKNLEEKFRESRRKWRQINEEVVELTLRMKIATTAPDDLIRRLEVPTASHQVGGREE